MGRLKTISCCLLVSFLLTSHLSLIYGQELDEDPGDAENVEPSETESTISDVDYATPILDGHYFYEPFDNDQILKTRWIQSKAHKADSSELKYDGEWAIVSTQNRLKDDLALMTKSKARHHAYAAKLDKIYKFDSKPFILQYEVQFRRGQECGGAYLKLLASPSGDLQNLNDKTPYSIMFGPDKCGTDDKVHFIFNHKNPKNGTITEKHWTKSGSVTNLDMVFKDDRWHQFRLELYPDNTFQVSLDKSFAQKGSLLEDFEPPVNPPATIDDPNDTKPEDWDEREKIPDPDAEKPDDWDENEPRKIADPNEKKPENWDEDEPQMIPDPLAQKPEDWDVEMDGDWEAPLIPNPKCSSLAGCGKWSPSLIDNPKYKGKWKAPLIPNPAYKGKWAPRKIPNPDFFEDLNPFKSLAPIDAVAFELWTISDEIAFDNILITDDLEIAEYVSSRTYQLKKDLIDENTDNYLVRAMKYANKNPWMWAVYLFAVGIPLVLFIAFCCVSPVKKTAEKEKREEEEPLYDPAYAKKTDVISPDVIPENIQEEPIGKIDEDDEEMIEDEDEEDEEEEIYEDEDEKSNSGEELTDIKKLENSRSSPRQRRSRKE